MSDEPTGRLIELGTFPTSGGEIFTYDRGESLIIREAIARVDLAKAEEQRKAQAAAADVERASASAQNTRKARAARRLKQALTLAGYWRAR